MMMYTHINESDFVRAHYVMDTKRALSCSELGATGYVSFILEDDDYPQPQSSTKSEFYRCYG
jgi:hypothetical protein